jgi:hypothetical protein
MVEQCNFQLVAADVNDFVRVMAGGGKAGDE